MMVLFIGAIQISKAPLSAPDLHLIFSWPLQAPASIFVLLLPELSFLLKTCSVL